MTKETLDSIANLLLALTPIGLSFLAYLLGVRQAKNEIINKRKIEIAEEIGQLIQILIENNRISESLYDTLDNRNVILMKSST